MLSSTLAHFRHFKLQTLGLQLIRAICTDKKIRHRTYESEHLVIDKIQQRYVTHIQTILPNTKYIFFYR